MPTVVLTQEIKPFIGDNLTKNPLYVGEFKLTIDEQVIGYHVYVSEDEQQIGRFKEVDLGNDEIAKTDPVTKQLLDYNVTTIQLIEGEIYFTGGDAEIDIVQTQLTALQCFISQAETPKLHKILGSQATSEWQHLNTWLTKNITAENLKNTADQVIKVTEQAGKETQQFVQHQAKTVKKFGNHIENLSKKKKWW